MAVTVPRILHLLPWGLSATIYLDQHPDLTIDIGSRICPPSPPMLFKTAATLSQFPPQPRQLVLGSASEAEKLLGRYRIRALYRCCGPPARRSRGSPAATGRPPARAWECGSRPRRFPAR